MGFFLVRTRIRRREDLPPKVARNITKHLRPFPKAQEEFKRTKQVENEESLASLGVFATADEVWSLKKARFERNPLVVVVCDERVAVTAKRRLRRPKATA